MTLGEVGFIIFIYDLLGLGGLVFYASGWLLYIFLLINVSFPESALCALNHPLCCSGHLYFAIFQLRGQKHHAVFI